MTHNTLVSQMDFLVNSVELSGKNDPLIFYMSANI